MANNTAENSLSLPARNQYPSRQEWEKACWKKIMKSEKLLNLLTTSNERRNITRRGAVMELVNSGKGTRQVSRDLQIAAQTVNSIKKIAKEKVYKSYRERGKTERKKKVYSSHPSKKEPYRYYRRTKYGKVYMPYR